MTLDQIIEHSKLITDDPYKQGEIRYLCLQVKRDEAERQAPSVWQRVVDWFFGREGN